MCVQVSVQTHVASVLYYINTAMRDWLSIRKP